MKGAFNGNHGIRLDPPLYSTSTSNLHVHQRERYVARHIYTYLVVFTCIHVCTYVRMYPVTHMDIMYVPLYTHTHSHHTTCTTHYARHTTQTQQRHNRHMCTTVQLMLGTPNTYFIHTCAHTCAHTLTQTHHIPLPKPHTGTTYVQNAYHRQMCTTVQPML